MTPLIYEAHQFQEKTCIYPLHAAGPDTMALLTENWKFFVLSPPYDFVPLSEPQLKSRPLWLMLAGPGFDATPGGRPYPGGFRSGIMSAAEGRLATNVRDRRDTSMHLAAPGFLYPLYAAGRSLMVTQKSKKMDTGSPLAIISSTCSSSQPPSILRIILN